jgi:hypothetical protein
MEENKTKSFKPTEKKWVRKGVKIADGWKQITVVKRNQVLAEVEQYARNIELWQCQTESYK